MTRASGRHLGLLKRLIGGGDEVVYRVSVAQPIAALTIDDGPFATSTPAILDVLDATESRATFFIIGSHVRGNEALMERLVSDGYEIGHHMLSDVPSHRLPIERFRQEFLQTHSIIRRFTNNLRWFRPGSGFFTAAMLEVVRDFGYKGVLGDVYPFDAYIPSVAFACEVIARAINPGSILILHDGRVRGRRTARTLDRAIPALKLASYRLVTLTELTAACRTGGKKTCPPQNVL